VLLTKFAHTLTISRRTKTHFRIKMVLTNVTLLSYYFHGHTSNSNRVIPTSKVNTVSMLK